MERELTITNNLTKPTIRSVFKENGELLFNVGKTLMKRFLNSFAFATKLNDEQITILTADAIECFKYESLEDLVLFLKMARQGKFGTTKRGVDSNLLFGDWFFQFMEQKAEIREKLILEQQNQLKQDSGISMKDVELTYKKAQERLKKEEKQRERQQFVDEAVEDLDKQGLEDLIFSWGKDDEMKEYLPLLTLKRKIIK